MKTTSLRLMFLLLSTNLAQASSVDDLNRNLPLEVEDARPTEAGSVEPQLSLQTERDREGQDEFLLIPQVQYGFSPRGHLQLSSPVSLGTGDASGNGDLQIGALYRLLGDEQTTQVATYAELTVPSGHGSAGLDTELTAILTQPFPNAATWVHLNLSWLQNAAAGEGERETGYRLVLGAHHKLAERFILLADLARLAPKNAVEVSDLAELGVAAEIGKEITVSAGAGVGLSDSSPRHRLTLAFQYSIQ